MRSYTVLQVTQWIARLTRNVEVVGSSPINCFIEQETLPLYCLVLVGSRNGFERDFTIQLNKSRALWKIDLNVK